jgi:hypothetical protein
MSIISRLDALLSRRDPSRSPALAARALGGGTPYRNLYKTASNLKNIDAASCLFLRKMKKMTSEKGEGGAIPIFSPGFRRIRLDRGGLSRIDSCWHCATLVIVSADTNQPEATSSEPSAKVAEGPPRPAGPDGSQPILGPPP